MKVLAIETGDPDIPAGDIGSMRNPRVWARVTTKPGTSAEAYRISVEHVLDTYNLFTGQFTSADIVSFAVHRTTHEMVLWSMQLTRSA